jgi:hypothetical protein
MKDKRRLERYDLSVPVNLVLKTEDGREQTMEAKTRDVSAKGAFLFTSVDNIDLGTPVQIEMVLTIDRLKELLDMGSQVKVEVDGKVVRINHEGAVVSFEKRFKMTPL